MPITKSGGYFGQLGFFVFVPQPLLVVFLRSINRKRFSEQGRWRCFLHRNPFPTLSLTQSAGSWWHPPRRLSRGLLAKHKIYEIYDKLTAEIICNANTCCVGTSVYNHRIYNSSFGFGFFCSTSSRRLISSAHFLPGFSILYRKLGALDCSGKSVEQFNS